MRMPPKSCDLRLNKGIQESDNHSGARHESRRSFHPAGRDSGAGGLRRHPVGPRMFVGAGEGRVEGDRLRADIVPDRGGDWLLRIEGSDGAYNVSDIRHTLRTDDGALILLRAHRFMELNDAWRRATGDHSDSRRPSILPFYCRSIPVRTFCTVSRRPGGPLAPPTRRARLRSRWRSRSGLALKRRSAGAKTFNGAALEPRGSLGAASDLTRDPPRRLPSC
jgi:hypothetical protein